MAAQDQTNPTMSEETKIIKENEPVLQTLAAILSLIRWLGGGSLIALVSVGVILISDHYDHLRVAKEADWIYPRFSEVWYGQGYSKSDTKDKNQDSQ
jgi:hypothetical protein